MFGAAVGGIGGPFHWDEPCAVVWDASGVGMAPLRAMQMLADGFAAPDPSWFRCQKKVSGKPCRIEMQVQSHPAWHLQHVFFLAFLSFTLLGHGSLLCNPSIPSQTLCLLCLSARSHQRDPLGYLFPHLAFLCELTISQFFPCCLIIAYCRVCLLLSELPGNGTKKPWETLLRNQACSHGDICGGKCSPYQQTARMQIHKQAQINRLTPSSKPETHPPRQMH